MCKLLADDFQIIKIEWNVVNVWWLVTLCILRRSRPPHKPFDRYQYSAQTNLLGRIFACFNGNYRNGIEMSIEILPPWKHVHRHDQSNAQSLTVNWEKSKVNKQQSSGNENANVSRPGWAFPQRWWQRWWSFDEFNCTHSTQQLLDYVNVLPLKWLHVCKYPITSYVIHIVWLGRH